MVTSGSSGTARCEEVASKLWKPTPTHQPAPEERTPRYGRSRARRATQTPHTEVRRTATPPAAATAFSRGGAEITEHCNCMSHTEGAEPRRTALGVEIAGQRTAPLHPRPQTASLGRHRCSRGAVRSPGPPRL